MNSSKSQTKTSTTNPIMVNWVDDAPKRGGKLGITFAPGKSGSGGDGRWQRDLVTDLKTLQTLGTDVLVCLLPDHELVHLGIPTLITEASARFTVLRLPIADGGVPTDPVALQAVVDAISRERAAGKNVVVHCRGGLGRAGTVGGCVLKSLGLADDVVFEQLKRRHPDRCPENDDQRQFIRAFQPTTPPATPTKKPTMKPATTTTPQQLADRIAGAVLGAAIGDAMGHPTEFMSMGSIRAKWGPAGVTGFEQWWTREGVRCAPYTDDTQMSEAVIRGLLDGRARGLDQDGTMQGLATRFVEWSVHPQGGHRAPGSACLAGCARLARGVPWREAGGPTAGGCGSVMRAWPFGLMFHDDIEMAEQWAVDHSRLTHNDPIALAACAALATGIVLAVNGSDVDSIADAMVQAAGRWCPKTSRMMQQAIDEARSSVLPDVTLDRLRGWAAHEAIAAAVYVFMRHPDDPRAAILEGANTPGDSDSIASIAGALTGARCGLSALPAEWVRDVERSTELLALASQIASSGV